MGSKHSKDRHRAEVHSFLQKKVMNRRWEIYPPPHGTGQESYLAKSGDQLHFIKLGVNKDRYLAMADLGLSPSVIAAGTLDDGTSILLQEYVEGRKPTRKDFQKNLDVFALHISRTHQSEVLRSILAKRRSTQYKDVGLEALADVARRWEQYKGEVPDCAAYVDEKIQLLKEAIRLMEGGGLVCSHGDPCNANWLVANDGRIYLLDYESMALDDPTADLGAIMWWYYPPEMRRRFIEIAGYKDDEAFRARMRIRMGIHCLHILLPRVNSFDRFLGGEFGDSLVDFRAVVEGRENPQGYQD